MIRNPLLVLALLIASSALAQNADLRVSAVAHLDGKVAIGEIVQLHVTVENDGPGVAKNVRATVSVPAGMAIVTAFSTPPGAATCESGGGLSQTATCSFGDLSTVGRGMRVNVRMPAAVGTFPVTTTVLSDTPDHARRTATRRRAVGNRDSSR